MRRSWSNSGKQARVQRAASVRIGRRSRTAAASTGTARDRPARLPTMRRRAGGAVAGAGAAGAASGA